jgi:hypothetical protein
VLVVVKGINQSCEVGSSTVFRYLRVASELPLAYIGNVSRTTASGRVRCGCEAFSIRR